MAINFPDSPSNGDTFTASENATLQFVSGPGQTLSYTVPTGFKAY